MTGALWAIAAGVGFGIFQTLNRRAVRGMDVFTATFIQLFLGALVLAVATLLTEDLTLLRSAPLAAWINFSLAGLFHFFIGWTFLNASQKKIGAARTGSLIGTTPLFAVVIAAATLAEFPTLIAIGAIFLIVGGVYLVNYARLHQRSAVRNLHPVSIGNPHPRPGGNPAEHTPTGWRSLWLGLGTALCWSISPIFIRFGLVDLPSPILGVTIGITACVLVYGLILGLRSLHSPLPPVTTDALVFKVIAALLVGLSTWARWIALDLAPVAMVLALSLVNVPIVNLFSPLLVGRDLEQVTIQVWLGSGLIVGGSIILIFLG